MRKRGDCQVELRICRAETMDEAVRDIGVCDNETVFAGTTTDDLYKNILAGKFVVSVELGEFTNLITEEV